MPFKKEITLKFPKCLHLEKLLLAYNPILLMLYNFCNHNIFISLKIAVIFKMDKVIASSCILCTHARTHVHVRARARAHKSTCMHTYIIYTYMHIINLLKIQIVLISFTLVSVEHNKFMVGYF